MEIKGEMHMKENRMEQRWDAEHYDERIGFVSRLGQSLIGLLQPKPAERILDLGCGTGDLTHQISLSGAVVTGLDCSETMIAKAKEKYPELRFVEADGETFRLEEGEAPYDAVFSNAALHWMQKPDKAIESVWLSLRPGGRFVAEFGGFGNVGAIIQALTSAVESYGVPVEKRYPWYFPSIGEYASLLEKQGFAVGYAELYDRPTPLDGGERGLRHWLAAFAGTFFAGLSEAEKEEVCLRCEAGLRPKLYDGKQWIADYRRIRIKAVKPVEQAG